MKVWTLDVLSDMLTMPKQVNMLPDNTRLFIHAIVAAILAAVTYQTVAQEFTFTYDASGNPIAVVSTAGSSPVIEAQPRVRHFHKSGFEWQMHYCGDLNWTSESECYGRKKIQ